MLSEIFIASLVLAWDEAFTRVGGTSPGDVTQQGDRDEQGSELATLISPGLGQKDEECEGKGWKESDREGICLHKLLPPAPPRCPLWEPVTGCSCREKATIWEVKGKESGSVGKTKGNIKNQPAPPEESDVVQRRILEKYKASVRRKGKGSMPNSPLIPSTTGRYNGLPDFPLSLFCFGPEIFANSGMLGILIRARALFLVLFLNPNGGEGPDFTLKKKKKVNREKKKKEKKREEKALLQRGSVQAVPILILSRLMENHQRLPHVNGTLSTGNVNAVTSAQVCQAYQLS